ncbi:Vesicle transport protein GOT1B [Anas platyrhynchos]|uniref:Vesicle transport protein GOT1B n=3 Tax=Anseriformes TaxID=8826 RepID=R0KZM4_ANAPL|nr:Vesicle transport protein GOT1B [Anas platyrhynchos]
MNSYLKSFFGQKASESIVPLRELHPTVRTAGYYHIIPLELFVSSLLGRQKAAMQTGSGHSYDKLGTSVTCHPAAQRPGAGSSLSPQLWEIGMGLTGFGVFFLFFGMILFFDKALLAIGNVLFVAGLAFVIGLERTFRFFFQKHKMKATGFFLGGVLIVLIGWPLIGMILEIYGFFLLFRGFFPVVVGFIRRVPVLGSLLNLPGISSLVDKVGESNNMV